MDSGVIPVCLFAYARPEHLRRTLECLRENQVPLIYAFGDGPKTPDTRDAVSEVRSILHSLDWCDVVLHERAENWGLGRSIVAGVGEVLSRHDMVLVFEDDLICVPGSYQYLTAAMRYYRDHSNVMSVTGWTHPRVIPRDVAHQPYFDGRAECWVWGTWARAWQGMERDAATLMQECREHGIDVFRYGADLPEMAEVEFRQNIWAVRWIYLHMLRGGLCLRPPHSLVDHIGFDRFATNAAGAVQWANPPLLACPPLPESWPAIEENPECSVLWRRSTGGRPAGVTRLARRSVRWLRTSVYRKYVKPLFRAIPR